MPSPLPLRSSVLVYALYRCPPSALFAMLARSLLRLPTHVWHLGQHNSSSATLCQPSTPTRPLDVTIHLHVRAPAVLIWMLATTPAHLLLGSALIHSLDEALTQSAADRRPRSGGRRALPSSRYSPRPAALPLRTVSGGQS